MSLTSQDTPTLEQIRGVLTTGISSSSCLCAAPACLSAKRDADGLRPLAFSYSTKRNTPIDRLISSLFAKRLEDRAFCWAHARRGFYELAAADVAPIAMEALERIKVLYGIEKDLRGRSADQRCSVWQEKSRPIVDALEPTSREKLTTISQKSKLAEAIRYAPSQWQGADIVHRRWPHRDIEINSNIVERAIRPIALNRKNALFAGSDGGAGHWAAIASLVEPAS